MKKIESIDVYMKEEIPDELHYKNNVRIGDILLVAHINHSIYINNQTIDWTVNSNISYFCCWLVGCLHFFIINIFLNLKMVITATTIIYRRCIQFSSLTDPHSRNRSRYRRSEMSTSIRSCATCSALNRPSTMVLWTTCSQCSSPTTTLRTRLIIVIIYLYSLLKPLSIIDSISCSFSFILNIKCL